MSKQKFVLLIQRSEPDGVKSFYFAGFDKLRNSRQLMTTDMNEAMLIESKEDISKLKGSIYEQCIVLDDKKDNYYGSRRIVEDVDKIVDEFTGLTLKEIVQKGCLMEALRKTVYPIVPGEARLFKLYRLSISGEALYYKYTTPDGKVYLSRDIEEAKVFRTTTMLPILTDSNNWMIEDWHPSKEEYVYENVPYIYNDFGSIENYLYYFDAKFVKVTSMYEVDHKARNFRRN